MKIGFPRPRMEEEDRIALLPSDVSKIELPNLLFFEEGYGSKCGFSDFDYQSAGANVVDSKKVYSLDAVCQPKFCRDDANLIKYDQTIFGWLHLDGKGPVSSTFEHKRSTAIAWELLSVDGKTIFQRNGELTARIGILHSFPYSGKAPEDCNVAVLGKGRVGTVAIDQLKKMGAYNIDVYDSKNSGLLNDKIGDYDVIVNCACTKDIIISGKNSGRIKPGALLSDLSCCAVDVYHEEYNSLFNPVRTFNGGKNILYRVDHIPTLWHQTASKYISEDIALYVNMLVNDEKSKILDNALVVDKGNILTERLSNK